jgi:hypothetical protein
MSEFLAGPLSRYLLADHVRLEALLGQAAAAPDRIDDDAFAQFRCGLLRHIWMEEKVLLPDARQRRGGEPLPEAAQLRLEHGALAALLVPPPTHAIVATLRAVLARHNVIEEAADGVYATCERLAGGDAAAVLERLQSAPEVVASPHLDSEAVRSAAARALQRAGFAHEADVLFPNPDQHHPGGGSVLER